MNSHNSIIFLKKVLKNLSITLVLFLMSFSFLNAQVDIKSKIDAQSYSKYSISIDLFEPLLNPNEITTIFLPINYAFERLNKVSQNSILVNKSSSDINQLLSKHSVNGIFDLSYFESHLNSDIKLNKLDLKSLNSIYYQNNGNMFLLGDSPFETDVKFETHIVKSIRLNDQIVLNFIDGIFLF